MFARIVASLVAVIAAVSAAGCASNPTSINAQWVSPTAAGAAEVQQDLTLPVESLCQIRAGHR